MARGGARQGKPGGNYAQRSDMRTTQPVQAPSGGQYGERKALEDAQSAMPLQNASGVIAQIGASQSQPSVFPGELGALDRPTDRPSEPVTHGAPIGPGAGPEALLPGTVSNTTADRLRAIYGRFPSPGLQAIIENLDTDA